jgi:Carboxypeptidase regulatory-like domain/TonB dependent receptor
MKLFSKWAAAWAILSVVQMSLLAQTATTALRGNVADPSGSLIRGATITLVEEGSGTQAVKTTDASGEYVFSPLEPGHYLITVNAAGFAEQAKRAELLVAQPATINFSLSVQASTLTVDVSDAAQTLNVTDATIGNAFNNATIEALPMEGRNIPDLLSLQPGVLYLGRVINQNNDSRSGAVAGARSDQSNVTLDGLDNNDQTNGFAFTGVLRATLDSTEEFRVTTTNANADAGRGSGAQVSVVTKSGGNSFHGGAYEYNRNTIATANNWFNKQAQLQEGLPNVPGKLIRNTFGASTGGPIKKDKLFFFFNYEGQRTAENQQVTQVVPTAAFRTGLLTYLNAGGSGAAATTTLTPSQLSQLDTPCIQNQVCPWGPGPNPNVLAYFNQFPLNNGFTEGDGYNLGSYSFSSPAPGSLNTSIIKLDYEPNQRHRLFVRGNLQKDTQRGALNFPGQPPSTSFEDNTKGLAAGDSWTISSNIINDLRYGYIRQGYSTRGIGSGDYVNFVALPSLEAQTRSTLVNVPVNNVIDDLSWTRGRHTIQVGGNWRLIHNNRGSDQNSFDSASVSPGTLAGNAPDPSTIGEPGVSSGFTNSYLFAYTYLVGAVTKQTNIYNYQVAKGGQTGDVLPDGAFINRHFKANEWEGYAQDSWRIFPNLTLTYGLRYTLLQVPYETGGQQIAPTVDTHEWFLKRGQAAAQGQIYEPNLTFAPNGKANGRPGYWPSQKDNFAPRIAIAYAPDNKTSVRAGWGMYYDHFGEGIVNNFDQVGSFGLSTSLTNPSDVYTPETAPRFTGTRNLPGIDVGPTPPDTAPYPYTPPQNSFAESFTIDNHLKTPYSQTMDFSVQRELPGGFTLEAAYVGRLGRHLLQQVDLAEAVNFVDTKSGMDYFTAGTMLSKLVDANGGDPKAQVPAIPYWENLYPNLARNGQSATQFLYTNEWSQYRYTTGETTALADIDFFCIYGCPTDPSGNPISKFWQNQFATLYAWSSVGMSYYNAGQLTLRHTAAHGLHFDFGYTFSKSIDMGSDAERASEANTNGSFSSVLNSWNPALNRGASDFDTRHLVTLDWVYELPVGHGHAFAGSANHVLNAVIGGWQSSGLARWTSGLPFSVLEPGWSTNWHLQSYGVRTGPVKVRKHLDQNGAPQVFDDITTINNGIIGQGSPIRLPYPGEAGERNNFRGDGYFGIDSGLSKSWQLWEGQKLTFSWQVFNVTNSVRFDTNPNSLGDNLTTGSLGIYNALLTAPRVQQFSLRYAF